MYDLTKPRDVSALRDIDRKLRDKRIDRVRKISVVVAMGIVFALWLVPGFWAARSQLFALPLLLDQLGLIVLIGLGMTKLLESRPTKPRFPYLDAE